MTYLHQSIINDLEDFKIAKTYKCLPTECQKYMLHRKSSTRILHINIRNISNIFNKLLALLSIIKVECDGYILTECWLSKVANPPGLDGYNSYNTKHTLNKNNGFVLFIKNTIKCIIREPELLNGN